ncbi:hypothetical protein M436DRAFT_40494 [Aureobasidium namibiae CBS 147.97]|uniref:Uncharacterized protein n=1 Tax=Aureobasidium namibiae CBS 147.97 TaxID=1043004 RepID=A0A074WT06_9PEZI
MDFPSTTSESTEYKALKSYLDDQASTEDTVNNFISNSDSSFAEDKLLRSWDALGLTASQTSSDSPAQEKLVSFLTALRNCDTKVGDVDGKSVSWSTLPLFGRQIREHWRYDERAAQENKEVALQWANANAFAARVTATASAFDSSDPLDFSLYAIWALRAALEDKDDVPEATVYAAAMWILYAGEVLRKQSKDKRSYEGKVAQAGNKYPNKEWTGFEIDRWMTWKNRFANISEVSPYAEVKDIAKKVKHRFGDLANC